MRTEPTEDELRSTWLRCRRDTWPATFEEAMAHALFSRLLRINAMYPPRAARKQEAPRERPLTQIPTPRDPRSMPRPGMPRGYVDRKRAAAGDRDDD